MTSPGAGGRRAGIVIPAHNAAAFIADTLESIRAQTHTEWRCVVVDDGSTDSTLAAAEAAVSGDPRIEVVTQRNAGPVAARNHGFAMIETDLDFVSFMDADDVWHPEALESLPRATESCPTAIGGLATQVREETVALGELLGARAGGDRSGMPRRLGRLVGVSDVVDGLIERLAVRF